MSTSAGVRSATGYRVCAARVRAARQRPYRAGSWRSIASQAQVDSARAVPSQISSRLSWLGVAAAGAAAAWLLTRRQSPIRADAPSPSPSPYSNAHPSSKDSDRAKDARRITGIELLKHNRKDDCWVCIGDIVYDVTEFIEAHPGGQELILEHGGKDVTKLFQQLHPKGTLEEHLTKDNIRGQVDPSFPPTLAAGADAEEIQARRDQLPPLSTILNIATFERLAKHVLGENSQGWKYASSYSDDGHTFNANRESYNFVRFIPNLAVDVTNVDPSTTIMSRKSPIPVIICPTGQNRSVHPEGEYNSLRVSAQTGIVQGVSNGASVSLEELLEERQNLADQSGGQLPPMWWQIYVRRDRTSNIKQIKQAAAAKVDAIILTVDAPTMGNHEINQAHPERLKLSAMATDVEVKGLTPLSVGPIDPSVTYAEVGWIKSVAPGVPVIVKGLLNVNDVAKAVEAGADGVVLSNHGGRQLDFSPPPLAVLARLQRERPDLLKKTEVYIDGGVTRGTDVLKALCLGAKGVGIGRTPMYASACYGQQGILKALQLLSDEIYTGMRMLGANSIADLKPEMVEIMPGLIGEQGKSR
ncbi:Karyopherin transporter [Cystobasidiomycetes sp. EMM_F5]